MKILLVVILILMSCNKKQIKIDVASVADVIQVRDERKPLFKLGSVFEGDRSVAVERVPVKMPIWSPEVVKIVRASIVVDTVLCVDTVNMDVVVHDTLYIETTKVKIVYNNWMQYVMAVCGFVFGTIFMMLIELVKIKKRIKDTEKRFM